MSTKIVLPSQLAGTLPVLMVPLKAPTAPRYPDEAPHPTNPKFKDLTGQVYGRLTVLYHLGRKNGKGKLRWNCRCVCGTETAVATSNLMNGHTQSCGCLHQEAVSTHGLSGTAEYYIWEGIINRCQAKTGLSAKHYSGRGITVSEEWRKDFLAFYRDMGPRPTPQHSIERADNSKGYCKENCKWDSRMRQSLNRQMMSNNTSGVVGVHWSSHRQHWTARISRKRMEVNLGGYPTKEEATRVRDLATAKAETLTYEQIVKMTPKEFRRFIRSAL